MPETNLIISRKEAKSQEIVIKRQTQKTKTPQRRRKTLQPEFTIHHGSEPIPLSILLSKINKVTGVVTNREKQAFPYPVLVMKPEVITVKWCRNPEPIPMSGFTSQGDLSITLNLLGHRRIGLDFLKRSANRLRLYNDAGNDRKIFLRPVRGPWTFRLSLL